MIYERLDNLGLVDITLSGVLGFLPKCASKGEIFVVFCLHIHNWWMTIFNACFTWNALLADFSSLIHASLLLIVWMSLSTKPRARWSFTGASIISILFLLQKFFTWWPTKHFAWSNRIDRGIPWFSKYICKKFITFSPLVLSYIHAVGYLEKRSIAARKYTGLPFSSKMGPSKSIWISWFGSTHGIWGENWLAGIVDLRFLPISVQCWHSVAFTICSRFMYVHQQCVAMQIIPQSPGWLAWISSISTSRSTFGFATVSSITHSRNVRVDISNLSGYTCWGLLNGFCL